MAGFGNLFAVEMDAIGLLKRFRERNRHSLARLAKMAHVSDQIDVRDFLEMKLPGMEELMILLEIVRLLRPGSSPGSGYDLVVWDTAPTGHTLRLLALPEKCLRWLDVLRLSCRRYMSYAGGIAALGLGSFHVRRGVKGNVRAYIEMLTEEIEKIGALLRSPERCEFVPVTINEELGLVETERLLCALRDTGVPVRSVVVNRVRNGTGCVFCSSRKGALERPLGALEGRFAPSRLIRVPQLPREVRGEDRLLEFARLLKGEDGGALEIDGAGTRRAHGNGQRSAPRGRLPTTIGSGIPSRYRARSAQYRAPSGRTLGGWYRSVRSGPEELPFVRGALAGLPVEEMRFLIFSGKGGVGKTTMAAAAALSLAESHPDKRVLVFSTDPAHSLADSYGRAIGDVETPVGPTGNLTALEIDGARLLEDFKKEFKETSEEAFRAWSGLNISDVKRRRLEGDRKLMSTFIESHPPGMEEVLALERVAGFIEKDAYDIYVFDTAPTGHLVEMLKMREVVRDWLRVAYRALLKHQREWDSARSLERIAARILRSQKVVKLMGDMLTDPRRTRFVAVAIPETMAVLETGDLLSSISRLGIACRHVIFNMVVPPTGCPFCSSRRSGQLRRIREAAGSRLFDGTILAKAPLHGHEIRGVDRLQKLGRFLFGHRMGSAVA